MAGPLDRPPLQFDLLNQVSGGNIIDAINAPGGRYDNDLPFGEPGNRSFEPKG